MINDVAERGCQLASQFKDRQTKNNDSWQEMLKTVALDRKTNPDANKNTYNKCQFNYIIIYQINQII